MIMLYFDIETAPLPDEQLVKQFEFAPQPPPEPFDPSQVKVGNMKDAAKIREKIEAARAAREAEIFAWESRATRERHDTWAAFKSEAALSPLTGRVVAIGTVDMIDDDPICAAWPEDEAAIIRDFWSRCGHYRAGARGQGQIVGHNILDFDLPFLARRSWALGVLVPTWLRPGRYWNEIFVDTIELWKLGQRRPMVANLDAVSRFLGGPGKSDGCTGGNFWEMISSGDAAARETAIEYLKRDVLEVRRIHLVMCGRSLVEQVEQVEPQQKPAAVEAVTEVAVAVAGASVDDL